MHAISMVFRLLLRLLRQSLDRDATAESEESATTRRPAQGSSSSLRLARAPLMLALFAAALAAVAISVLLPTPRETAGGPPANLVLSIPEIGRGAPRDLLARSPPRSAAA